MNGFRMLLHRFFKDPDASVAPLFGIAFLPLLAFIGTAIDYGQATSARADLQVAADAAALMVSKNAPTLTSGQLQQNARDYFMAGFNRPTAQNVNVAASYDAASSSLTLSASASVPTVFMGMFGFKQIDLSTSSTVAWGTTKLRVALVLDNTGSMNDFGKITALKTASHQLLAQLQKAAQNPADVQVAIVPFTTDVNIGTIYQNATWVDWSQWSLSGSIEAGLKCAAGGSSGGNGFNGTCGGTNHGGWNGCVMDRGPSTGSGTGQGPDVENIAPVSGDATTYFPADQSPWCPVQMMPLSNDWTALNSKIDAMVANGFTNQSIGLAWGWQALTPTAPLNAAPLPANTKQIIILLSDGMNNTNRWSTSQADVDAREKLLCANVKNAGITVYTVLVMAGDSAIMQQCASDPGKYFALTQAGQIVTTFNQIGTALAQLRIAK